MVEVIYFSFTGNSKKIAEKIAKELEAELKEIKPKVNLPYLAWLILSFVPGLGFPVEEIDIRSSNVVVCFPKWTFNCPPVTRLVKKGKFSKKRVALVISYKGWNEKRFAESYRKLFEKHGAEVKAVELVKRDDLKSSQILRLKNLWMS